MLVSLCAGTIKPVFEGDKSCMDRRLQSAMLYLYCLLHSVESVLVRSFRARADSRQILVLIPCRRSTNNNAEIDAYPIMVTQDYGRGGGGAPVFTGVFEPLAHEVTMYLKDENISGAA